MKSKPKIQKFFKKFLVVGVAKTIIDMTIIDMTIIDMTIIDIGETIIDIGETIIDMTIIDTTFIR